MVRNRAMVAGPAVLAAVLIMGCGKDVTGPRGGAIHVALAMVGPTGDPDGASVSIDRASPVTLFAGEHKEFPELLSGSHIVELAGLAEGCTVSGENPLVVAVSDGQVAEVRFDVSCVEAPTTGADPAEVLATGGLYVKVEPYDSVQSATASREQRDDGTWSCTTERHSAVEAPDDYATFDPNAEVIYPGVMLQGATLVNATPEPIVVPRAGGTIAINLLNGSPGVAQTVGSVKQSTVVQAINDILAQNTGIVPARFTYTSSEVQSREQLALSLGVNVSTLSTDFKSRMSFSTDQQYNRFLVQMTQSYYTVVFDLPESLHDLIADGVTGAQLDPYVGPGNPATYISSVTYGRRFFLLIESTSSLTEMKASIQASYDAALVSGSLDASATYVKDLKSVNVKVFALGGDQSMATAMFNGDFSAVKTFLTEGADIRTAVPLSYVVRNALDNSVVAVKVATDYDVKNCVPMTPDLLYSGFASDAEGWTSYANGNVQPDWVNEATCLSNTGGCLHFTWGTLATAGYYRAPESWLGGKDWSGFYGGMIEYRMRTSYYTSPLGCLTGCGWNPQPHVVIQNSSGQQIAATIPEALLQPMLLGWGTVAINLVDSGTVYGATTFRWRTGDHDATEAEIRAVLARVTYFFILGSLRKEIVQHTWLDEVRVIAPTPSAAVGTRRAPGMRAAPRL